MRDKFWYARLSLPRKRVQVMDVIPVDPDNIHLLFKSYEGKEALIRELRATIEELEHMEEDVDA